MRVVRVITRLNRGGPLRQLEALVPGLARLGVKGPVLTGEVPPGEDDGTADLARHGVEIVRVPGLVRRISPWHDGRASRWLRRYLADARPDVVHTHTSKAGALARRAAARAGVPVIVHTFHGHHFDVGGVAAVAAKIVERRLARITTRVIALSARQRDDLVARHAIAPEEKVVVIPPVIDEAGLRARATAQACAAFRAAHAHAGETVLLFIGRHVHVKDPLALIEAFARARVTSPGLRLWLAGDGPLRAAVLARVRALGLSEHVTDHGPVADSALVVGGCDAVVLASRSEGTPIAILEARALCKTVIATAVGGVPDLVASDGVDELVQPGDLHALAAAMVAAAMPARHRDPRRAPAPAGVVREDAIHAHARLYGACGRA